jgi:hypothetical protein
MCSPTQGAEFTLPELAVQSLVRRSRQHHADDKQAQQPALGLDSRPRDGGEPGEDHGKAAQRDGSGQAGDSKAGDEKHGSQRGSEPGWSLVEPQHDRGAAVLEVLAPWRRPGGEEGTSPGQRPGLPPPARRGLRPRRPGPRLARAIRAQACDPPGAYNWLQAAMSPTTIAATPDRLTNAKLAGTAPRPRDGACPASVSRLRHWSTLMAREKL